MKQPWLLIAGIVGALAAFAVAAAAHAEPLGEPADSPTQWRGHLTLCIEDACWDFTTREAFVLEDQCRAAVWSDAQYLDIQVEMSAPDRHRQITTSCTEEPRP